MKILCVIDCLQSGGSQRQLVELATGFSEKGHLVSFLVYHQIPFFNVALENACISVTYIEERNYLLRIWKIRKYIRSGKYDAVLSFLEAPVFICEVSGFPHRTWRLVVGERSTNPGILKSFKLILFRWFHFYADYVVSNSNSNLRLVRKVNPVLSSLKCKVIYNAVDFNRWRPIAGYTPRRNGKTKIVVCSRFSEEKNLNGLIEALGLLNFEERGKIQIEWYGDNGSESFADSFAAISDLKIKEYGLESILSCFPATYEITRIIQDSDAAALFSFHEGLPNSVCEAMACAKPVICCAVSDLPELLSSDPNLLFNPASPQSIKQAICYLIGLSNDQLLDIGLRNKKIARERFNREAVVSKYLELLKG